MTNEPPYFSQDAFSKSEKLRLIGWGLAAVAIALLFFASPGYNTSTEAYKSGRDIGIVVRFFSVIYIVAYFIFRKRSREMKDRVTLAIGFVALLYSLATAGVSLFDGGTSKPPVSSNSQITEKALIAKIEAIRVRQMKKLLPIFDQVKKLELANVVSPSTLASRESIKSSKVKLVEYIRLINERESAVMSFANESQSVLKAAEFKPIVESTAFKLSDTYWQHEIKVEKDWARIQRESTEAFGEILTLVDTNFKDVEISNGVVTFSTKKQVDAYELQNSIVTRLAPQEPALAAEMKKSDKEFDAYVDSVLKRP